LMDAYGTRTRQVCSCGADIQRLREIEKFQSRGVCPSNEYGNLHVYPLRTPLFSGG